MDKPFQSILFLSTGRTGTKFLASILRDSVPKANVYHEAGERSRWVNILSHARLAGIVPDQLVIAAWKGSVRKTLTETQKIKQIYIDANNHIYQLAVRHPELYPALKVVHIVRDPRTYIRSHLNWSRGRIKSFIANYLTPFWQPTAPLVGDMSWSEWLRLGKLERFAWVWTYKNKIIGQLENSPVPYLRVRFEDLFSSTQPAKTYLEILDFIGLKDFPPADGYFQRSINASQKRAIPDWQNWTDELCSEIDEICGGLMVAYGYGGEDEWMEKVHQDRMVQ